MNDSTTMIPAARMTSAIIPTSGSTVGAVVVVAVGAGVGAVVVTVVDVVTVVGVVPPVTFTLKGTLITCVNIPVDGIRNPISHRCIPFAASFGTAMRARTGVRLLNVMGACLSRDTHAEQSPVMLMVWNVTDGSASGTKEKSNVSTVPAVMLSLNRGFVRVTAAAGDIRRKVRKKRARGKG